MKFQMDSVEIESSGIISENTFGIADMGFILHLLRNKIYSDIKKAICQEYACNARDAHREAGKAEVPIEITLPTFIEPNFRVRDFGNSISPENMVKVFIQYGASTKRESNQFTGGFGIGCKTAFGYTDAFIVNTFINGIHRSYSCVIDDTRCGKLALLSETVTTEPNGTEIVIPVQNQDILAFSKETHRACRHWDVKPIIHGGVIEWNDFENVVLDGTNWFVTRGNDSRSIRLVVDGVEYPCNNIDFGNNNIFRFGYGTILYLKFPTGVISVSANREQVENDDNTKKAILKQLSIVNSEIEKRFEDAIKNAKDFIDANVILHNITTSLRIEAPQDIKWNDIPLFGRAVNLDSGRLVKYVRTAKGAKKESKYDCSQLPIEKDAIYCKTHLDFNKNVELGVTAIFKTFPDIDKVYMIRFNSEDEIQKKNLHLLNILEFSNYYTLKSRKSSLGRLMFFKMNEDGTFSRSSLKEYETDTNKKFWCSLSKEQRLDRSSNGLFIKFKTTTFYKRDGLFDFVTSITETKNVSLYGFSEEIPQDRLKEATEEMENLEEFMLEYVKNNNIDIGEVNFAVNSLNNDRENYFLFTESEENNLRTMISKIKDKSSPFVVYLQESGKIQEKMKKLLKYKFFLCLQLSMENKDFAKNLQTHCKEVTKEYPLFRYMTYQKKAEYSSYYTREITPEITEIVDYVNLCYFAKQKMSQ